MCDDLLAQAETKLGQLDAVAFGQGPGSFTGLRIAAGVIQGMAYGADLPVIKISTLAALAQQIAKDAKKAQIIAAIDARMQEIYWCIYTVTDNGFVLPSADEAISSPHDAPFIDILKENTPVYAIGSGWDEFDDVLAEKQKISHLTKIFKKRLTSAEEIGILATNQLKLGNVVSAADAIPVYLRNNVAKKSSKQI